MQPNVHCSIIHGGQDMETTELSLDRGLGKADVVHVHHGVLLSQKQGQNTCHWQQHGWTLRVSCYVIHDRQAKQSTPSFHSCVGYQTESNKGTNMQISSQKISRVVERSAQFCIQFFILEKGETIHPCQS